MLAVICNRMDIQDSDFILLAFDILEKGQSLIITGNGGQGKSSLMMRIAVDMAENNCDITVIWISLDIVSAASVANFWNRLQDKKDYLICLDSPFYNQNTLKQMKDTFPAHLKGKVRFLISERIQNIDELLEEESIFTGWFEPVHAICCIGDNREYGTFQILDTLQIPIKYYTLKPEWKHAIIKRTCAVLYGNTDTVNVEDFMKDSDDKMHKNILPIAEQIYQIFFEMEKKYPRISGINLDWKEWKEHLQRWFHDSRIDEYYYEPIAAFSLFSMDLDADLYEKMMRLPNGLADKMSHYLRGHIEPLRYLMAANTIHPKHDNAADIFFNSHPKSDPVDSLIRYIKITKDAQKVFDHVLRKGKLLRNPIVLNCKKIDYSPLMEFIEKNGYDKGNKSRFMLTKIWSCSTLEDRRILIYNSLLLERMEEFTDDECSKLYTEIGITFTQLKEYEKAEEIFLKAIKKEPDNMPLHNELGRLYVEQKRFDQAEATIEKENIASYNELGRLYVIQKQFDKAEAIFLKAIEKEKIASYNELGLLYVIQKQFDKAETIFLKAIEKENIASYNELGLLYLKQKRFAKAEAIFLEGLEMVHDADADSYLLTSLIKLYHKSGNYQKANKLISNYTNKKTAYYTAYCKECYKYLLKAKGIKDAGKYKNKIKQMNNYFNL